MPSQRPKSSRMTAVIDSQVRPSRATASSLSSDGSMNRSATFNAPRVRGYRWTAAVVCVVAVVGACGTSSNPSQGAVPSAVASASTPAQPSVSPPGSEAPGSPTLAPDRLIATQTIAFTFEGALYTALGDGSKRTLVTDFPGEPYPYAGAFWSPDRKHLIIRMEADNSTGTGGGYIYKVSADGSEIIDLSAVSGSGSDAMPAWSPDGRKIVYSGVKEGDPYNQLYVMNADGTDPQLLVKTEFEAQYPAWSSTGQIAFAGVANDNFDIYIVNADGSNLRRLTEEPAQDNWPTWSPDGTEIAFFSNRAEKESSIWAMAADGSGVRSVVAEGGEPNWSPHGDEITYDCGDASTAVICAVHPDGSGAVRLFADAGFPTVRP